MLTDEDRNVAEEWAKDYASQLVNGGAMSHSQFVRYLERAMLQGIEHERKRQQDVMQMTLECVEQNTPVEQVGERHWRIKEGHE